VNCTHNLGHKIGGAVFFVSKLTREDKIKIYERRKNGETIPSLAKAFNVQESNIKYLIALIKENGYNVVEKKKGRKPKSMTKLKKNDKTLSEKEKIKQLEEENLYLKAENEYLKKLKALVQERKLKEKKK